MTTTEANWMISTATTRVNEQKAKVDALNNERNQQLAIRSEADKKQRLLGKSIKAAELELLRFQSELLQTQSQALAAAQASPPPAAAPTPKRPRAPKATPTPTVEAPPHETNGVETNNTESPEIEF